MLAQRQHKTAKTRRFHNAESDTKAFAGLFGDQRDPMADIRYRDDDEVGPFDLTYQMIGRAIAFLAGKERDFTTDLFDRLANFLKGATYASDIDNVDISQLEFVFATGLVSKV